MIILATSDFHGILPFIKEPFDLLLIAGDVCPVFCHAASYQKDWLNNELVEWANSLPFKTNDSKVILTPGNHDFFFERALKNDLKDIETATSNRLKILKHDEYNHDVIVSDGLDTVKIFGTSYCSIFGNWAFMVSDETLEKKFSQIPEDVDILISHDSPNINGLGDITEGPFQKQGTGNQVLAKHIERVKPKIFVSGHFHSGNHKFEKIGDTYMANVSYVNEDYNPVNPILKIEYDEETRTVIGNSLIFS